MFSEVFIKQLVEDVQTNKAEIKIKTSGCLEPVYRIIITKNKKTYKFDGISKNQLEMLQYLLGV